MGTQVFSSSSNKRPLFNGCSNNRLEGVCLPFAYCNAAWWSQNYYYVTKFYRAAMPGGLGLNNAKVELAPSFTGTDGASRRAWWSMQPRFEGEFAALNAIYELKDFKDIAKRISSFRPSKVLSSVASIKRQIRRFRAQLRNGSNIQNARHALNLTTKTLAEVHLTKVYAVDPTVRDLGTLYGQLQTLIKDVQQEFFDRGKNTQSTHYSEVLEQEDQVTVGTNNNYWQSTGTQSLTLFTATMEYRYGYKMRKELAALKRYYGLNLNAEVIWNALPFSFVIDYFYKVAQALHTMQTDPNVELRLLQYCESVLKRKTAGVHFNGASGSSLYYNRHENSKPTLLTGYQGSWYLRRVTTPNKGAALPRLTLPSSKQAVNLVALVRALW
jgi:hypothetical protein